MRQLNNVLLKHAPCPLHKDSFLSSNYSTVGVQLSKRGYMYLKLLLHFPKVHHDD